MATRHVASEPRLTSRPSHTTLSRIKRAWIVGAIAFVMILVVGVYFVNAHWPFRYRIVKPMMEDVLGSQLQISSYHRTYFPHPGFVATGIKLRRKSAPDLPPLGSIDELIVQGRWTDLLMLRARVALVDITALHIVVPALGSRANHEDFPPGSASDFSGPDTLIEQLKIHRSLLDIMRSNGMRYSFPIPELDVRNFQKGRTNTYTVSMQNAKPWGLIQSTGSFGPLNAPDLSKTPVTGTFSFSSVKLSDVGEMRGTLQSSGQFRGPLGAIEATASSDTPDFAVGHGKPTPMHGEVECTVDGVTGEVVLHQVRMQSGETTILASGGIVGSPKITNIDVSVTNGRTQDVLRPFVHDRVPITGPVWLHAHAYIGPTGAGFLQRLYVRGAFDVPAERATDRAMEKSLSDFSKRAQTAKAGAGADDSEQSATTDAVSSLKGPAQIRDGVVSSPHLVFQIPGAQAILEGTFSLHDESAHLTGKLAMQSEISHAATGFKSFLLKPLDPFMKKRKAGAVVPIAITGTPGHYKIDQNFGHLK
jgi:AsmA-like C-terminal region